MLLLAGGDLIVDPELLYLEDCDLLSEEGDSLLLVDWDLLLLEDRDLLPLEDLDPDLLLEGGELIVCLGVAQLNIKYESANLMLQLTVSSQPL